MIDAPTIRDAAARAERLRAEGFLAFVDEGSTYSIRPSSRRETDLLQRFLNACNRADDRIHLQSDFDGLLARRQSLLMSFFMGLYLAPAKIKEIAGGAGSTSSNVRAKNPSGGSGGIDQDATDGSTDPKPTLSNAGGLEDNPGRLDQGAPASGIPDNSSQDAALAAILGSVGTSGTRDRTVDLGDDEIL